MATMPHLVVVIPGITGSVLAKNGTELWAPTPLAFFRGVLSRGASIKGLQLLADSPDADDIGDGVTATRLIPDVHLVPGLHKIDGYTRLCDALRHHFDLVPTSPLESQAGNFVQFAYDWRRDNRYSARCLKSTVAACLARLRKATGNRAAKVILITHSMGGLLSRYYLECLNGWPDCLALISFGTPYRGSVNSLNYLANGYKAVGLELTGVLRSCTSMYQLLPIYPCIRYKDGWHRVAELDGLPGIDRKRAEDALLFHREIENAVELNRQNVDFAKSGYRILPFVGISQPTLQSATFDGQSLLATAAAPEAVPAELSGGDGTVPRVSATPIELSTALLETFHLESHSSLQNNTTVLADIVARVEQMVGASSLAHIRGVTPVQAKPGLSMALEDVIKASETVRIAFTYIGKARPDLEITVRMRNRRTQQAAKYVPTKANGHWHLSVPPLGDGVHEVEAVANDGFNCAIHDVFEVLPDNL